MTARHERDESYYPDALMIAWEIILPYRYVSIIQQDEREVQILQEKLEKLFEAKALKKAAKKIRERIADFERRRGPDLSE